MTPSDPRVRERINPCLNCIDASLSPSASSPFESGQGTIGFAMREVASRHGGRCRLSADESRAFIEFVLGDMTGNAAMALATGKTDSGKLKVDDFYWFAYPAQLEEMVAFSTENWDRDLYLSPIVYGDDPMMIKGKEYKRLNGRVVYARSKRNARTAQTIYMDSDACPPEAFRLPPSMHVQTSEGHGHDYWQLMEPIPASEAAEIAHRITTAHKEQGSDPTGWSQNKVLRMPTVNTAHGEPFDITWSANGTIYDPYDISGAYDDIEVADQLVEKNVGSAPTIEGLPDFVSIMERIPQDQKRLQELIFKAPPGGDKGWRSQQRWALILDLMRFGFDERETAAVVWNAPAGAKWHDDDRSIDGLWMEIGRARTQLDMESGQLATPAPDREVELAGPKLLSPSERSSLVDHENFLTFYLEYARSKVRVFNEPLHRMNAWMILATAFGEIAFIPKSTGPMPLNLFTYKLSPSSTGKSEAEGLKLPFITNLFPKDDPMLGAKMHPNALIEKLTERGHKVTLLHADEAHGYLAEIKSGGWHTGIAEMWTHIYDGKRPEITKVGQKVEPSDKRVVVNMEMTGTLVGMLKVLDHSMFTSGYLARQLFAIGQEIEITEEDLMPRQEIGDVERAYDRTAKFWSSVFFRIRNTIRNELPAGKRQVPMVTTDEALARMGKAFWKIRQHFKNFADVELYRPVTNRMNDNIWKASALVALAEGRHVICERHVLVALQAAEHWLSDMIQVAEGITDSALSRTLNDIENFIASQPNQRAEISTIYRLRKGDTARYVEDYLATLSKQGRIRQEKAPEGAPVWYELRRDTKGKS